MNPISAFFVRNIIAVFFFYGLAFFALGLALLLASRRTSEFTFARAILPLAVFGILHGLHEWVEMYQKIATLTGNYVPTVAHEVSRLALLVASFAMLAAFGFTLVNRPGQKRSRIWLPVLAMIAIWLAAVLAAALVTAGHDWRDSRAGRRAGALYAGHPRRAAGRLGVDDPAAHLSRA